MADLPTGTVTFLFTDLEGSTRLWEDHPEAMKEALARHDEILRDSVTAHGGHVVKMTGDGVHAAFADAANAVRAAADAQRALTGIEWGDTGPLLVRMGVHSGPAETRDGDYYGNAVNRAARLMNAAHGGQVIVSLTTEELLRDAQVDLELLDLGEHRLRDLSHAEHIFQLHAPGLTVTFPPLRTLEAFPSNLPTQLSSFVGREAELDDLAATVERARLVTITGVGGVGKTRLATQLAAELLPLFPDGAWVCEIAPTTDQDAMLQTVSTALGAVQRAGMSPQDSIVEFLRGREALIVLDNCEHLLDAAARLVTGILRASPHTRIVATSREGLGVEGEQVYPLRSLGLPTTSDVDTVVASDAVRLFTERAAAVRPGFAVDRDNARAVVEVCRRLDGIALAIELAAARVASMSAADVARHLDERFRLLTGGRRTGVERHQTLRGAVDWSYSLLSDTERAVFDRLGVFAGGFDEYAAEAVAAADEVGRWDVVDALASLVSKSMVVLDEETSFRTRYQLLETLRQYARERLDDRGQADSCRRRHAAHFADLAEAMGQELWGRDEFEWRARFHEELPNLRAAVTWALESADLDDGELAVRIVGALSLQACMDRASGISALARQTMARAEVSSQQARNAVWVAATWDMALARDFDGARAMFDPLWADVFRSSDFGISMSTIGILTFVEMYSGGFDRSREMLAQFLKHIDEDDAVPTFVPPFITATLAMVDLLDGSRVRAKEVAEQAVALARGAGNPSSLALSLYALGWATMGIDSDQALALFGEAIALVRAGATDMVLAHCLVRAATLRAQRRERAAIDELAEAVTYAHVIGSQITMTVVLDYAIDVLAYLGHADAAAVLAGAVGDNAVFAANPAEGPEEDRRRRSRAHARASIGDDAYERAVERGMAMTADEVRTWLLDTIDEVQSREVAGE